MQNVGKNKKGRPIVGYPKDIRLTVRIDNEIYKKLVKRCEEKKISQSEYIRQLISKD